MITSLVPDNSELDKTDLVIVIIGMGYVGLTFSVFVANSGFNVIGIERNLDLSEQIARGETDILDVGLKQSLKSVISKGKLTINQSLDIKSKRIFVVTVGTPIGVGESNVDQLSEVGKYLINEVRDNDLVVLRSTVGLGTTQKLYEQITMETGKQIYFAMCPERTIEGRALEELEGLPQVVSGVNEESLKRAQGFFNSLGVETVLAESTISAEFIKLISNSYRDLNFAFANEISLIGACYSIDSKEAIRLANYKYPRNNIQYPGLTGGPCLEKDPLILAKSANEKGIEARVITEGRKLNESLPSVAIKSISQKLRDKKVISPKFLILGIAFKGNPETSDTRGTLAYSLAEQINNEFPDCEIIGYDPALLTDQKIHLSKDLKSAMRLSNVIIVQHNGVRLLTQFKEYAMECVQPETLIYDFWGVVSESDIPTEAKVLRFGM